MSFVNRKEYLEQLETLVNIESGSYNVKGLHEVADELSRWFEKIGWCVKRHDIGDKTGPVLEICNREADYYDVMFVGHMDTVFPDGTVKERPFSMDETKAYGPGVSDMKQGDVAIYQVVTHLSETALDKLNICVIYNPDEEIGSIYSKELLDKIGEKAKFVYVMEANSEETGACFARKGRIQIDLEFYGKSAHSGFMFQQEHASTIVEMGHYILKLSELASEEHDTTVNIGVVSGGIATNVVPEFAKMSFEARFKKESERLRLEKAINSLIEGESFAKGVTVKIVHNDLINSWEKTPESLAHIEHLKAISSSLCIPFKEEDRGGLSDANHLSVSGSICSDGMGPQGDLCHSPNEYTIIDSIQPCVQLLCAVLEDLAKNK